MQNKLKCREFQHCSGMHIKTSRHDCRREKLEKKSLILIDLKMKTLEFSKKLSRIYRQTLCGNKVMARKELIQKIFIAANNLLVIFS